MNCTHCGKELSATDKSCPKCGQKVEKLSPLMKGAQIFLYILSGLGVISTVVVSVQTKSLGFFVMMAVIMSIGWLLPTLMTTRLEREGSIKDANILILLTFIGFGLPYKFGKCPRCGVSLIDGDWKGPKR